MSSLVEMFFTYFHFRNGRNELSYSSWRRSDSHCCGVAPESAAQPSGEQSLPKRPRRFLYRSREPSDVDGRLPRRAGLVVKSLA